MTNPAPIKLVNKKIIPKASIYYCFKILLAKKANIYVENTPDSIVTQFTSFDILVYKGATPPNTSDTNVNLDKSKKYPASFSRLTLSFSLPSRFSSCCFFQLFIMGARYKIFVYNALFIDTLFVETGNWKLENY